MRESDKSLGEIGHTWPADDPASPSVSHGAPDILSQLLERESTFRDFIRRRVGEDMLADDLLQQSLMRAVEQQHSVQNSASVVAWFYRILRNAVIDYYRTQATETKKVDGFMQELITAGEDKTPALDELRPAICGCLQRLLPNLRPGYAELIRRIDLEGESSVAVAEDLKVTANNLTVRLHRVRQALRAALEGACGVCTKHGCLNCTCE